MLIEDCVDLLIDAFKKNEAKMMMYKQTEMIKASTCARSEVFSKYRLCCKPAPSPEVVRILHIEPKRTPHAVAYPQTKAIAKTDDFSTAQFKTGTIFKKPLLNIDARGVDMAAMSLFD